MEEKTILCYGDSNTYGFNPQNGLRYKKHERWTGILGKILGQGFNIIEEGCNGRTTIYDDPIDGWKNGVDYLKPCINSHKPVDMIIVMLGSNDLKNVFGMKEETIGKGIEIIVAQIIEFTKEKQGFIPRILIVSPPLISEKIKYAGFGYAFSDESIRLSGYFSRSYQQVARQYRCEFFDASIIIEPSDIDGLHLSKDSHRRLAESLADVIVSNTFPVT